MENEHNWTLLQTMENEHYCTLFMNLKFEIPLELSVHKINLDTHYIDTKLIIKIVSWKDVK